MPDGTDATMPEPATDRSPIDSYQAFWPYYLSQHRRPLTRALHYLGTSLGMATLIAAVASRELLLAPVAVVVGYGPAWLGHVAIERNRPATFRYPLWSLISDFRMLARWASGRLGGDLAAAGVKPSGATKNR